MTLTAMYDHRQYNEYELDESEPILVGGVAD